MHGDFLLAGAEPEEAAVPAASRCPGVPYRG